MRSDPRFMSVTAVFFSMSCNAVPISKPKSAVELAAVLVSDSRSIDSFVMQCDVTLILWMIRVQMLLDQCLIQVTIVGAFAWWCLSVCVTQALAIYDAVNHDNMIWGMNCTLDGVSFLADSTGGFTLIGAFSLTAFLCMAWYVYFRMSHLSYGKYLTVCGHAVQLKKDSQFEQEKGATSVNCMSASPCGSDFHFWMFKCFCNGTTADAGSTTPENVFYG